MDTRSLDRLGVYIPRGDASRVFVNPAGTIPPSPAIYGKYNIVTSVEVTPVAAVRGMAGNDWADNVVHYDCVYSFLSQQLY